MAALLPLINSQNPSAPWYAPEAVTDPRIDPNALLALDADITVSLGRRLAEIGLDATLIASTEAIAPGLLDQVRLPLVHQQLRGRGSALSVAARLFCYRDEVNAEESREAIGGSVFDALERAGTFAPSPNGLRSRLRLMPFAGMVLASDEVDGCDDPVMGPGATTAELWGACAIDAGSSVLDVGCGAGSLALAAARAGASKVVGVDLDPRAIAFARFNAKLAGLNDVEFACGNLLQPVTGRTFDVVVSQPPFVTQPPSVAATTYLHGGQRGDELALRLLGELPSVLAPDGRAVVLMDTAPPTGESVAARIRGALGDAAVRTFIVVAEGHGADRQSIGYASAAHSDLGPKYAVSAAAYRAHLESLGVETTHHVLVELLRVKDGAPAFALELRSRGHAVYSAADLAELGAAASTITGSTPELLETRVQLSPNAWLCQEAQPATGERRFRVRFEGSRARDRDLSEAAATLVELGAKPTTVRGVIEGYAEVCGAAPGDVERPVLDFVRESLASGLFTLASD